MLLRFECPVKTSSWLHPRSHSAWTAYMAGIIVRRYQVTVGAQSGKDRPPAIQRTASVLCHGAVSLPVVPISPCKTIRSERSIDAQGMELS